MRESQGKKIRWLVAALDDLEDIVAYISQDNPPAAKRFAESLFAKVELLAEAPHLGAVCPHYRKARQVLHGNYIIYYTTHEKEVVIRAVVHGARLFRSYWLRGED